ncbi:uncharacterized protein LOC115632853 [Scaptodrosophila lebanonensis]|uniref:Uncharacterized protein LOC115632853 n=1 Tax=Drosophila lebanonensis TaxID=7225 RepID=A0A6J2UEY4_DROLE|nr:uncharacterized protein LOC115632853 [Scaptodrosophila lebanonensis]
MIPGTCPKLDSTIKSTTLKGSLLSYGMYLDLYKINDTTINVCEFQNYPPKYLKRSIIIATDNKNFVIHWKCKPSTDRRKHTRATFIFTQPTFSEQVAKYIDETHVRLGLKPANIVRLCERNVTIFKDNKTEPKKEQARGFRLQKSAGLLDESPAT